MRYASAPNSKIEFVQLVTSSISETVREELFITSGESVQTVQETSVGADRLDSVVIPIMTTSQIKTSSIMAVT